MMSGDLESVALNVSELGVVLRLGMHQGNTRHQRGGWGVVRRLTPRGVTHTRRSETAELSAAKVGSWVCCTNR